MSSDAATPESPWHLASLVDEARRRLARAELPHPRREAEALLHGLLDIGRATLFTHPERPIPAADARRYLDGVARRERHEPLAYITGRREFWSLTLEVSPAVLIPRPATEHLVEAVLERIDSEHDRHVPLRIVDVGTGSGAIALALATELPAATIVATDRSAAALRVAHANTAALGLTDRIELRRGDGFGPLQPDERATFDVIVSNPPYVAEPQLTHLMSDVRDYEPVEALAAGPLGLDMLRILIAEGRDWLRPGGWLALEHGAEQGPAVAELLARHDYDPIALVHDYEGHDRVHLGRQPAR